MFVSYFLEFNDQSKVFLKGFFCIRNANSLAIALAASFIAIGALFKTIGLNIQESIFSTFLTYALPDSLIVSYLRINGVFFKKSRIKKNTF